MQKRTGSALMIDKLDPLYPQPRHSLGTHVGRDRPCLALKTSGALVAVVHRGGSRGVAIGSHRAVFGVGLPHQAEEAGRAWVLIEVANSLTNQ